MIIDIADLKNILLRAPALVLGPGVTTYPTIEADCLTEVRKAFAAVDIKAHHYYDLAELVTPSPARKADPRELVRKFFQSAKPNPQLDRIVSIRWAAAVSLTADGHFASALRHYLDKQPLSWTVTKVLHTSTLIEPKSVPVYELLGDIDGTSEDTRLAVLRSDYLARRRQWAKLLRSFPDFVKTDPLFFAGTACIPDLVCDFLNELLALGAITPRRLIFLADDSTAHDPRVLALVRTYCQVDLLQCSLGELCEEIAELSSKPHPAIPLRASGPVTFDATELLDFDDQIAFVPYGLEKVPAAENKHRLLDILFSPTNPDWSPYAANLDFKREITPVIEQAIIDKFVGPNEVSNPCLLVKGEAGTGKTVLLRRVAFNLAQNGYLSIWVRRGYAGTTGSRFEAAVHAMEAAIQGRQTRVAIFYDDPLGGRIAPRDVLVALSRATFQWVLVFSARNTDLIQSDDPESSFYADRTDSFEVPTDFKAAEVEQLPGYLTALGAAQDENEARRLLATLSLRDEQGNLFGDPQQSIYQDSKDILCMLWYLLPGTRSAISESLTNEYLRLGGIAGAVRHYADASSSKQGVARSAYELVTTTSGMGTTVPVEVLVSALGISYQDWAALCSERKPLWGLLYSEPYPEAETYGFRTRNHVVTKILLSVLNGGGTGHPGEFRCLKQLITACNSGAIQYREFLCDILIRRKKQLEHRLSYEQGLELFDLALKSFPFPDRTLAHHRALWIKEVGRLPLKAYEELQAVQRVPLYPQAQRPEPVEHIHTSMAACALQAVSQSQLELVPGVELVRQHIAQASTPYYFDLHSQHVHAKTLLKLATALRETDPSAFMTCLEEATRIIGRALLVIDPLPVNRLELTGAPQLFKELLAEIAIAFTDEDTARNAAFELFNTTNNQMGFTLAARMMIAAAKSKDKGGFYKKCQDFINQAITHIQSRGQRPDPGLLLCRAELMITWHILSQKGGVSWECLRGDLKEAISTPHFSRDPLWIFYLAVAHYHLKEMPLSEALFATLRQLQMSNILRNPFRCSFIGPDGSPQTFQGTLRSGGTVKRFIECAELGTDVMARKGDFRQPDKATVHFKVAFSMLGPLAVPHTIVNVRGLEH
jgi:hypothetical protein